MTPEQFENLRDEFLIHEARIQDWNLLLLAACLDEEDEEEQEEEAGNPILRMVQKLGQEAAEVPGGRENTRNRKERVECSAKKRVTVWLMSTGACRRLTVAGNF